MLRFSLTGRFNLFSCNADEACHQKKGVEQVSSDYIWSNIEVSPILHYYTTSQREITGHKTISKDNNFTDQKY